MTDLEADAFSAFVRALREEMDAANESLDRLDEVLREGVFPERPLRSSSEIVGLESWLPADLDDTYSGTPPKP